MKEEEEKESGKNKESTVSTETGGDAERTENLKRLSEDDRNLIGKTRFKRFIKMIENGDSPKDVIAQMNRIDDEYYKEELKWYLRNNYKIDLDTIMK